MAISGNYHCLNESPSEKEGKCVLGFLVVCLVGAASMKVPPKRKGNPGLARGKRGVRGASMKVPPKRKGNMVGVWFMVCPVEPQ